MDNKEICKLSNLPSNEWESVVKNHQKILPIKKRTEILQEFHKIIKELNVDVFLTGGSLLGAIRENDFIEWDDDIDTDMLHEDFIIHMYTLKEKFINAGFIVRLKDSKKFPKMSIFKNGQKIAIGALFKKGRWRLRPAYRYQNNFFIKRKTIIFKGMDFLTPYPPKKFLRWVYGDWQRTINSDDESEYMNHKHLQFKRLSVRLKTKIIKLWQSFFPRLMNIFSNKKIPLREPLYIKMIDSAIVESISIIDIGSSDGLESKYILKNYTNISKIFLIEPYLNNLNLVKKNISSKFDQKISYHNFGISNKSYNGKFYVSKSQSNLNSTVPKDNSFEPINIEYIGLDKFIESNSIRSPLLIMMDIEGQEVKVLEGLFSIIDKLKSIKILFEVHPHFYNKENSLEKVLDKFFNNGFKPSLIESAGCPVPEKFKENGLNPISIEGNRALFENPSTDFVLKYACHPHKNAINYDPWVTKKIVRSLLIEKN